MQGILLSCRDSRARGARVRLVGVAAGLAVMMAGFAMPSSASALSRSWNCGVIPVDTWCQYTDNHSWTLVSAQWGSGANPTNMCAKIINGIGQHNGTRNCGYGTIIYSIPQPAYVGPNTYAAGANGSSGGNKTINCWATT